MLYFIVGLVVVAVIAVLLMRSRGGGGEAQAPYDADVTAPLQTDHQPVTPVTHTEVYAAAPTDNTLSPAQMRAQEIAEEYRRSTSTSGEVGWHSLDDEADRPEVDAQALAAARANVSQDIPDEVLEEMLLQATPQQAAQLFAGVSDDVMADLTAHTEQGVHYEGQAGADDLAALSGLGSAVDDLDIWDFADDTQGSDSPIKA